MATPPPRASPRAWSCCAHERCLRRVRALVVASVAAGLAPAGYEPWSCTRAAPGVLRSPTSWARARHGRPTTRHRVRSRVVDDGANGDRRARAPVPADPRRDRHVDTTTVVRICLHALARRGRPAGRQAATRPPPGAVPVRLGGPATGPGAPPGSPPLMQGGLPRGQRDPSDRGIAPIDAWRLGGHKLGDRRTLWLGVSTLHRCAGDGRAVATLDGARLRRSGPPRLRSCAMGPHDPRVDADRTGWAPAAAGYRRRIRSAAFSATIITGA